MRDSDRLTIEEVLATAHCPDTTHEGKLAKQLVDTMRENERLREALNKYANTKNPDIALEALRNKDTDNG